MFFFSKHFRYKELVHVSMPTDRSLLTRLNIQHDNFPPETLSSFRGKFIFDRLLVTGPTGSSFWNEFLFSPVALFATNFAKSDRFFDLHTLSYMINTFLTKSSKAKSALVPTLWVYKSMGVDCSTDPSIESQTSVLTRKHSTFCSYSICSKTSFVT